MLRDVAGWAESLSMGHASRGVHASRPTTPSPSPHRRARRADGIGALVLVVDPADSLRQTPGDGWAATPVDRMEALLRESRVQIGIVTDGRWWGLVCAREGTMAASGIVDAHTWIEDPAPATRSSPLIGRQHIIGGDPAERLTALFGDSVAAAEEITEALGTQVRRAVELLVQAFSESAADARRRGRAGPAARPDTHDSLPGRGHRDDARGVPALRRGARPAPAGRAVRAGYGISDELDTLAGTRGRGKRGSARRHLADLAPAARHHPGPLLAGRRSRTSGMPSYGGSLFDPARFPFLTATTEHGTLAVTVSDRVMLHVLRSVQMANVQGESAPDLVPRHRR